MRRQWRILDRGAWDSLLHVAWEARLFVIVCGAVCEKSCVKTSMLYEGGFGWFWLPGPMLLTRVINSWNMNGCVWQDALLFCFDAGAGSFFHSRLSIYALAVPAFAVRSQLRLPVYADLFGIFPGTGTCAWRCSRKLARIKAPRAMPYVGQIWV